MDDKISQRQQRSNNVPADSRRRSPLSPQDSPGFADATEAALRYCDACDVHFQVHSAEPNDDDLFARLGFDVLLATNRLLNQCHEHRRPERDAAARAAYARVHSVRAGHDRRDPDAVIRDIAHDLLAAGYTHADTARLLALGTDALDAALASGTSLPDAEKEAMDEAIRRLAKHEAACEPTTEELAKQLFSDVVKQTGALLDRPDLPEHLSDTILLLSSVASMANSFLVPEAASNPKEEEEEADPQAKAEETARREMRDWVIGRHRSAAHTLAHRDAKPDASELRVLVREIDLQANALHRAWKKNPKRPAEAPKRGAHWDKMLDGAVGAVIRNFGKTYASDAMKLRRDFIRAAIFAWPKKGGAPPTGERGKYGAIAKAIRGTSLGAAYATGEKVERLWMRQATKKLTRRETARKNNRKAGTGSRG